MKRMLSIILAMLLLATLFAGCAGNTAPANSDTPATTDTAQTVTDTVTEAVENGAAAVALLLRHTVVVDRHEQLGIPLQADDGELAQGDVQAVYVAALGEGVPEAVQDGLGDLGEGTVAGAALAYVYQLHVQDDGVHGLSHCLQKHLGRREAPPPAGRDRWTHPPFRSP